MREHRTDIVEVNDKERIAISFSTGKFQNFRFVIDGIQFSEPENELVTLSFEYDLIDPHNLDQDDLREFEKEIGDFIVETLENQVEQGYNGDIAFTGGI